MYSDGRWPVQNGNVPLIHRETTGQGQREQFQGVVVPINGNPIRGNIVYQTDNYVPATYVSNGFSQVDTRNAPSSQTSHLNSIPLDDVQNVHINGSVLQPTSDRQISAAQPLDYQLLLLSLAEEYLAAAHSEGSMVALLRQEVDMRRYYKLVATCLGCLEAVLKVSKRHSAVYWSMWFIVVSIGEWSLMWKR